jgi:hypothetical protein
VKLSKGERTRLKSWLIRKGASASKRAMERMRVMGKARVRIADRWPLSGEVPVGIGQKIRARN